MISRLTLLLKGKVILAIVGTLLVAGGGTTIAVAATGAKVSIPLVSQGSPSEHQSDSTSSTATASEGQDNGQQAEGTVSSIDSGHSSFTLTPEHGTDITVVVNAQTEFDGVLSDFSGLKVGLHVEATGTIQTDGSLLATKVEGQDENDNQDEHELNGTILSVDATNSSFVLKFSDGTTKTIEVSAQTEFNGDGDFQRFSDLKVGQSVEVEGNLQSNGTIAATKVHREDNSSSGDNGSGGSNGGDNGSGSGSGDGGGTSGGNGSSTPSPNGSDH